MRGSILLVLAWSGVFSGFGPDLALKPSAAQTEEIAALQRANSSRLNLPAPTLGGKQFWADELFFHAWRIQRNALTGHYRLLDESDVRRAWGTFAQCQAELERVRIDQQMPPMSGKAVVVLHGLGDARCTMAPLCRYLEEHGGYKTFNVSYPSTRDAIAEHARSLAKIVEGMQGIEEISFVGHSMGNIVVRHYLADQLRSHAGQLDPRIKRMVMIGPPNHGSELAASVSQLKVVTSVLGKASEELGVDWEQEERNLAVPPFDFGIIAGGFGKGGINPWVAGDDDGIVSVESTRLAGASDFAVIPVLHALLPRDLKAQQYTLRFLQHGCFVAPNERHPIKAQ